MNNMRVIDVCDNSGGANCLKKFYEENQINNYKIIDMGLNLAIGDIKNNHLSFLKKLYNDDSYDYNNSITELLNSINDTTKIRIWSSKGNDNDYLLLLYLCNLLKDKSNHISVIFTTDYNDSVLSINSLYYKEIDLVSKYEKMLTLNEINNYSSEWEKLLEVNSELRVLENGIVKNKSYSDYDNIILRLLSKIEPCTVANLIGELMANFVINDTGSAEYQYLIDRLINQNKIRIIEKEDSHFNDIIETVSVK